jgi:hypothetical protein
MTDLQREILSRTAPENVPRYVALWEARGEVPAGTLAALPEITEEESQDARRERPSRRKNIDCRHRGEVRRVEKVPCCPRRVDFIDVQVFACGRFGECQKMRSSLEVRSCSQCPARESQNS